VNNPAQPPKNIIIVGGGTGGWMTASLLQHAWRKHGTNITLIESPDIATIGVGEGSTPYLKTFFNKLSITEQEWMPACNATYKCGISFPNWSSHKDHNNYFHPFFSPLDLKSGNALFENCVLRRKGQDAPTHPNDFFVSAALARNYLSPIPQTELPFIPDYGYHFDAVLLGKFLRQRAIALGINHIVDTVTDVAQADGVITSLSTHQHGELVADFFIDCSGFAALLIGKTLNETFISYADSLFNDAAVAIATPIDPHGDIPSETVSGALKYGWAWQIPLASRYGNGYVYSSQYVTSEDAEAELRQHLGDGAIGMPARHIKMRVGRVENHWSSNCLAVGLSQGFVEPLEATALMLMQFSVEHFIVSYEKGQYTSQYQGSYNKRINQFFDGVRDYIVMHYKLNQRTDSSYWLANRENTNLSANLRDILASWDSPNDFEQSLQQHAQSLVYLRPSWYCILAGMGRFPAAMTSDISHHVPIDAEKVRSYCESMAQKFVGHREQLQTIYGDGWPASVSE